MGVGGTWATITGSWSDVVTVARSWWWIPLGVAGWLIVAALGFAANRVGVAAVLGVSVTAQLTVGLAIDTVTGTSLVGSRPFIGVALALSGVMVLTTAG